MLHSEVVKLIEEYKKAKGEPPVSMLAIYNYIHEEEIEKTQKAKKLSTNVSRINSPIN